MLVMLFMRMLFIGLLLFIFGLIVYVAFKKWFRRMLFSEKLNMKVVRHQEAKEEQKLNKKLGGNDGA